MRMASLHLAKDAGNDDVTDTAGYCGKVIVSDGFMQGKYGFVS